MQRRVKRKSTGQAIIEFTLMLPIVIVIIGGLTDLGLALYVSIGLQNAVREGARIAATIPKPPGLGANNSTVVAEVKRRIPPVGQFSLNSDPTNNAPGGSCDSSVTVSATGTYNFMFLKYIGFTDMTISRSTTMRYEGNPLCT